MSLETFTYVFMVHYENGATRIIRIRNVAEARDLAWRLAMGRVLDMLNVVSVQFLFLEA